MSKAQPRLVPLSWDSAHFGFPVGRMESATDIAQAAAVLKQARGDGIELVYWQPQADEEVSAELLHEFTGSLVDRKATYQIDLAYSGCPALGEVSVGLGIREYPRGPASAALCELAIEAGAWSRFRRDPVFPEDIFRKLYTTWIEQSCRHELADAVLVIEAPDERGVLGMVTVAAKGGEASIGLMAVAAPARGQGVGRFLMQAAHQWMATRSFPKARVVTQLANQPACRLYERCGYQLALVQPFYHFWPRAAIRSFATYSSEPEHEPARRILSGAALPASGPRHGD